MKENITLSKISLISSMLIFGSIGIFAKATQLPSDVTAMTRGLIGAAFLALLILIKDKKLSFKIPLKIFLLLLISGAFLGFNWILLFESYKHTSVAVSTLCYYLAPAFVLMASPFLLKESLDFKKPICLILSLIGMMFVTELISGQLPSVQEYRGIFLGIAAAALYAGLIITNKKITAVKPLHKTFFELLFAGLTVIPYSAVNGSFSGISFKIADILLLAVMGVVHTGFAYTLYFYSMKLLKAQTVALWSYIDPIFAIILSSLVFPAEKLSTNGIIGAVLILGSAILGEIKLNKKAKSFD